MWDVCLIQADYLSDVYTQQMSIKLEICEWKGVNGLKLEWENVKVLWILVAFIEVPNIQPEPVVLESTTTEIYCQIIGTHHCL